MDARKPPEYILELSADRNNVKDVVKGILHTIFFHRIFKAAPPAHHDVLDLTLPYVSEDEIEDLIEARTNTFIRQLDSTSTQHSSQYAPKTGRGQLILQFLEKRRRKGWFVAKADEETVWETWVLDVTLTSARMEVEMSRNKRAMEERLLKAAMDVVVIVNRDRNFVPPITTTDTNPFPYQILVNTKGEWSQKIGIL